ncbi:MAG: sensor histidine kinase [Croceimicrobium sp.]
MKTPQSKPSDQDLLSILDQAAIGLIVANKAGDIRHMNQMAEMMVLPLFMQTGMPPENILGLLEMIAPGIANTINDFPENSGFILTQQKQTVQLEHEGEMIVRHFFYSINKVSEHSFVYSFDDITNYHVAQEELARLNQEIAIDRSKFEMAAGVLHDIGNAVVGIGSHLTKARRSLEDNDLQTLNKLLQFFEARKQELADALGADKSAALVKLVQGLQENQQHFHDTLSTNVKEQMGITSHISDILNIQRQYVSSSESVKRDPVDLKAVLYDALSILMASIEKREIELDASIPDDCPKFVGDRTKLIQVFINLIKNALDAIDESESDGNRLQIALSYNEDTIEVMIADSGVGFEPEKAEQFFDRGFSTKDQGSGIGLATSRSVIESHSGVLQISSEGPGKGAKVSVSIPLKNQD